MSGPAYRALSGFEEYLGRDLDAVARDLESFAALLKKWQPAQNLVSRETLDDLWTRHIRDSLQLLPHLPERSDTVLDFGSGGGFPALPMAIALKMTSAKFVLIESNTRKCSFLRTVTRTLGLSVNVLDSRVEFVSPEQVPLPDIITCRATAALEQIFAWIFPLIGPDTRLLLHKGREHGEEWRQAAAHWEADVLVLPSLTDPEGVVLDVRNLKQKST